MFGQHYQRRDDQVAGAVLADLLNRSLAVEIAFRRVYETQGTAIPGDHQEALQDLARVVATYLDDVSEARTRGLRARVFGQTSTGNVTPEVVDSEEVIGELVTADRPTGAL